MDFCFDVFVLPDSVYTVFSNSRAQLLCLSLSVSIFPRPPSCCASHGQGQPVSSDKDREFRKGSIFSLILNKGNNFIPITTLSAWNLLQTPSFLAFCYRIKEHRCPHNSFFSSLSQRCG